MTSFDALLEAERRRKTLHRVLPFDWQLGLTHGLQDLSFLEENTTMPSINIGVTPTLQVVTHTPLRLQTSLTPTAGVGAIPHINRDYQPDLIQHRVVEENMPKRKRRQASQRQQRRRQHGGGHPRISFTCVESVRQSSRDRHCRCSS